MTDATENDETEFAPRELSRRERRFAEEYAVDLSLGKAAKRAHVSDDSATAYLNKQNVRDYIQALMDEAAKRSAISADYVLSTIQDTIERCREAAPVMRYNKKTGEYEESGKFKFDSAAVLKGCELLGRHLVLFTDKTETHQVTSIAEVDAQLADMLKKLGEKP